MVAQRQLAVAAGGGRAAVARGWRVRKRRRVREKESVESERRKRNNNNTSVFPTASSAFFSLALLLFLLEERMRCHSPLPPSRPLPPALCRPPRSPGLLLQHTRGGGRRPRRCAARPAARSTLRLPWPRSLCVLRRRRRHDAQNRDCRADSRASAKKRRGGEGAWRRVRG